MFEFLCDLFLAFYIPGFLISWVVIFFASYVPRFRIFGLYGSFQLVLSWFMVFQIFLLLFTTFLPQEVAAFNRFFPEVNLQWLTT